MDFNTARNQANRFDRALKMKVEGYRMELATKDRYDVFKPGNNTGLADYTVDTYRNTCDCEDSKKGNICKHYYFVLDEIDNAQMWEAQCSQWESENGTELPDMPQTLTVGMVLEALQARILQDMDRAEAVMLKRDIQPPAVKYDRQRRFQNLQGAFDVIGSYQTKEECGLLDLTQTGYVSSVITEDVRY